MGFTVCCRDVPTRVVGNRSCSPCSVFVCSRMMSMSSLELLPAWADYSWTLVGAFRAPPAPATCAFRYFERTKDRHAAASKTHP